MLDFEKQVFLGFTPIKEKLLSFGFAKKDGCFCFEKEIMDSSFILQILINGDDVKTSLIEKETNEDYGLYRVSHSLGTFGGRVRQEILDTLSEVKENCFCFSPFSEPLSKEVISYTKKEYGEAIEFLWPPSPSGAIRRKDNKKWYAVVMRTNSKNLGLTDPKGKEIVLLRGDPSDIDGVSIFPGFHMNKKKWVSVILDGSLPFPEIAKRLRISRDLALRS